MKTNNSLKNFSRIVKRYFENSLGLTAILDKTQISEIADNTDNIEITKDLRAAFNIEDENSDILVRKALQAIQNLCKIIKITEWNINTAIPQLDIKLQNIIKERKESGEELKYLLNVSTNKFVYVFWLVNPNHVKDSLWFQILEQTFDKDLKILNFTVIDAKVYESKDVTPPAFTDILDEFSQEDKSVHRKYQQMEEQQTVEAEALSSENEDMDSFDSEGFGGEELSEGEPAPEEVEENEEGAE